uniref:Type I secretion system permease/ATPase n=1 Tax=Agrobacterium albertimagni TaxID=147266 RepID=A0A7C1SX46_9HYPH
MNNNAPAEPASARLDTSSGLECLAILGGHFRRPVDRAHLIHELQLETRAADEGDLVRAARMVGLKARLFTAKSFDDLAAAPRPLIVRLGKAFALVLAVDGDQIHVLNPLESGRQSLSIDEFKSEWTGSFILVTRRPDGLADRFGLTWFTTALKKFKRELALVLLASLFVQIPGLATPLLFQIVIDKVLVHNSVATLTAVVVGLMAVNIFQALIEFLRTYLLSHTASRVDVELGAGVFNHMLRMPVSYFETRPAGQTVARVRELDQIRQFLTGQALTAGLDFVFAFVLVGILYVYSPLLAFIVTLSIPVYVVIAIVLQPILMRKTEERFNKGALSQQLLVETVLGIQTVKASAAEPQVRADWEDKLADYIHTSFSGIIVAAVGQNLIQWVVRTVQVVILFLGAYQVIGGAMTVGALIAFNMIMGQITGPVLRLSQLWQDFQQVKVSAARLGDILQHPQEPRTGSLGALPAARGDIVFSDVTFRYRPDRAPVMENMSFEMRAGTSIGIIGPSGSGKSTLSKLVQRLYIPERGQVLIDGLDISQVDPAWLRRQVGVVLQENFLFNRTIHENIAFSNPSLSRAQVIQAARLAGAHDFIGQMPEGYDTQIEERGANLSGGQRQRIAIARALATNPRILIFDEATSALDYESEEAIQANMREISRGRTVIVIAHRLAAVTKCDRIISLERGKITEDGKPGDLIQNKSGFFARMLHHQNQQVFV